MRPMFAAIIMAAVLASACGGGESDTTKALREEAAQLLAYAQRCPVDFDDALCKAANDDGSGLPAFCRAAESDGQDLNAHRRNQYQFEGADWDKLAFICDGWRDAVKLERADEPAALAKLIEQVKR